jgi:hypothetical protein
LNPRDRNAIGYGFAIVIIGVAVLAYIAAAPSIVGLVRQPDRIAQSIDDLREALQDTITIRVVFKYVPVTIDQVEVPDVEPPESQ